MSGRVLTAAEVGELKTAFPFTIPEWLAGLLMNYPLAESEWSLSEEDDETELGVEMRWLTPSQMINEALETFPGIAASPRGYLPVGMCLEGTGDPYFINVGDGDNPPLVRIPHEAVDENDALLEEQVEVVCSQLSEFFEQADMN